MVNFFSRRMISSAISDVVIASMHSENTSLKDCTMIMIMIIMNKLQEMTVRAPEINFCYETEARTVMIDFIFDALYRVNLIDSLLKSG